MIENIHQRLNGPVFKVIFGLVSLALVLTGVGTGLVGNDTSAVKVNGEAISQRTFNDTKGREQTARVAQLGERYWDLIDTPEYLNEFNQSVLNKLIDDELLRQYAKDLKLAISAEQIKQQIVNEPAFQQDGKFNNQFYLNALRNNGINADQYAAMINEAMLFSQLQEGIANTNFLVPKQQDLLAKLLLQQRQVRLAVYPIQKEMEKQAATQEELSSYYEANKDKLIAPDQVVVEFVSISPKDIEKNIEVTDEQINKYYNENKAQYVSQAEQQLAHIQVATEAEAQAVENALKNGESFATLAEQKSIDRLSAKQGGDLGWSKAGTFPAEFEQAAKTLEVGQVSSPIKVDNAFHLIKVLDRKTAQTLPLAKVKEQIIANLRSDAVLTEYGKLIREMENKAFESGNSLDAVAKIAHLSVKKTDRFAKQQIPAELNHEKIIEALFNSDLRQTGQNSTAIDVSDTQPRTVFLRVSDFQAQHIKSIEEARATLELAVKRRKAEEFLLNKANAEVAALQSGKTDAANFGEKQTFAFDQAHIAQPILAKTMFTMPKPSDKPTYSLARNHQGDIIIIALDKVIDGDSTAVAGFNERIQMMEQLTLRNELLKDLRTRAKIEINQDFFDQVNSTQQ